MKTPHKQEQKKIRPIKEIKEQEGPLHEKLEKVDQYLKMAQHISRITKKD